LGNVLIIRVPNYDKSHDHVESEGYIILRVLVPKAARPSDQGGATWRPKNVTTDKLDTRETTAKGDKHDKQFLHGRLPRHFFDCLISLGIHRNVVLQYYDVMLCVLRYNLYGAQKCCLQYYDVMLCVLRYNLYGAQKCCLQYYDVML
jgi:hypothetical protein